MFEVRPITYRKSGVYKFPDKCLRSTIMNNGGSKIFIFDSIPLEPGESFPIPDIQGKYLTGDVVVRVVANSGTYTNKTIVSFINLIDIK